MERNLRHFLVDWLNWNPGTALSFLEENGIRVARDSRYPDLYCLKYGSVFVDKTAEIVRACRGAVVEKVKGKFELRAYAFDRFFNLGEQGCHQVTWDTVKVAKKYDGSLIKLFSYRGEWLVSTSGSVAGASKVGDSDLSFAELFWQVFHDKGYTIGQLDPKLCYIFELCHRLNKVVVDYETPELPLLAVRDSSKDFEELNLEKFGKESGFAVAEFYDLSDERSVVETVSRMDSSNEGVVLYDGVGRVKVKSDLYCQLHRAKGNDSPDFSELYLNGDLEEFLLHFPEYAVKFNPLVEQISKTHTEVDSFVEQHSELPQKDFAIRAFAELGPESSAAFSVRSGKFKSFAEWLESRTPKQLDRFLGIS